MNDRLDSKIRELTVRLMQSAPEAPPFPEEPMTSVKPSTTTPPRGPRRTPVAAWAAAAAFGLVLLIGLPLFLLRGGDEGPAAPTTTTGSSTTSVVPPSTADTDVTLYFVADYVQDSSAPGPFLVPVDRVVQVAGNKDTGDALAPTIEALLAGPTTADDALIPGLSSGIPADVQLLGFTLDNTTSTGVATLDFNAAVESGGGTFSMTSRLAQIVYTATQFPGVDGVVISIDGEPVSVFSSEGLVLDGPQSRDDYRDILPPIFVESPLAGATVTSPVSMSGIANTFEAGIVYRIETADGTILSDGPTTASCGTGCWGDFDISASYTLGEPTPGFVVLYEDSAQDGRPINMVRIPVNLEASETAPSGQLDLEIQGLLPQTYDTQGPLFDGGYTTSPTVTIGGSVTPGAAVTVTPGTVTVPPDQGGGFEAEVSLQPGANTIVIEATLGDQTSRVEQTITYLPDGETNFSFLTKVSDSEVVADYAQWLSGDAANQAAFEDGVIGSIEEGVPNDYYIRNVNTQLRTLQLSPEVLISLPTSAFGSVENVPVPLEEWLGLFKADGSPWDYEAGDQPPTPGEPHFGYFGAGQTGFGYWLTLDGSGTVVQVIGQYRP